MAKCLARLVCRASLELTTRPRFGRLEAELGAVKAEVDRPLRRERNKARQEASDEREHGRKREDELLDLVKATQRQLEDQTKSRSLWQRISGKGRFHGPQHEAGYWWFEISIGPFRCARAGWGGAFLARTTPSWCKCRLLYRGLGQALSGYVMPYSFFTSFCTG